MDPLEPSLTAQSGCGQGHPLKTRRHRNRSLLAAPRGWGDDVRNRSRTEVRGSLLLGYSIASPLAATLPLSELGALDRFYVPTSSTSTFIRTVGTWTVVPRGYFPPVGRGEA